MYKYLLLLFIYSVSITSYLVMQYNSKENLYHQNLQTSFQKSLDGVINSFELLNNTYHNQYKSKIASIIRGGENATQEERNKIRSRLRETFTPLYENRKISHLNIFHIFDKNAHSLLRFHQLTSYDDPIIDSRDSLKTLFREFRAQQGLEIGKYAISYRFQYPLFYDGDFVGGYEFGVDFRSLEREMHKLFGIKNTLCINAKDIEKITPQEIREQNYSKVLFDKEPFYLLKGDLDSDILRSYQKLIKIHKKYKSVEFFSFSYQEQDYTLIKMPIRDINQKYIGFILTYVEDDFSAMILRTFIEELTITLLFGLILLYLFYKESEYKKYVRNIIDTQHDILIVTNGKVIKDANRAFLEFFNVGSIKEFNKRGTDCICDYFLQEHGHIEKNIEKMTWVEYIKKYPDQEHIATFENRNKIKRNFKITLEGFSTSMDFIVIFSDITEELIERQSLENKAYYDNLTQIYSRERFNHFLTKKIQQKRDFSLIMFDIDHFKRVNDRYGHDAGDRVLQELTQLVTAHIRKEDDTFARWGGEEFMIIVPIDIFKAEKFANKLRVIIEKSHFTSVDKLTCSFGVARYLKNDTLESILKRADSQLYEAKHSGRNCVKSETNKR